MRQTALNIRKPSRKGWTPTIRAARAIRRLVPGRGAPLPGAGQNFQVEGEAVAGEVPEQVAGPLAVEHFETALRVADLEPQHAMCHAKPRPNTWRNSDCCWRTLAPSARRDPTTMPARPARIGRERRLNSETGVAPPASMEGQHASRADRDAAPHGIAFAAVPLVRHQPDRQPLGKRLDGPRSFGPGNRRRPRSLPRCPGLLCEIAPGSMPTSNADPALLVEGRNNDRPCHVHARLLLLCAVPDPPHLAPNFSQCP